MKKCLLLLVCLLVCDYGYGQAFTNNIKLEKLHSEKHILKPNVKANKERGARTTILIKLPRGTKYWYYSFTTSTEAKGTAQINLLQQLSSKLTDSSTFDNFAFPKIEVPSGTTPIDLYVLDEWRATDFITKKDFTTGIKYSTINAAMAKKHAFSCANEEPKEPIYLCLRNLDSLNEIEVRVEVVAIVARREGERSKQEIEEERIRLRNNLLSWTKNDLQNAKAKCLAQFNNGQPQNKYICKCLNENLAEMISLEEYKKMPDSIIEQFYTQNWAQCLMSFDILTEQKNLQYQLMKQIEAKDFAGQEQTVLAMMDLGFEYNELYINLANAQLCLHKLEEAQKTLTLGLEKKPNDLFLIGNLANYYLLSGAYKKAIKIYKEHKEERLADNRLFKEAVSDDLNEFERLGMYHHSFDKVRAELNLRDKLVFTNSDEKGRFKKIIFDKKLDTTCYKEITQNESDFLKTQEYYAQKDSSKSADFMNNRGKLYLESINEKFVQQQTVIMEKSTTCDCYYDEDTLFIQIKCSAAGGWFGGPSEGIGWDIAIINNQFSSQFNRWSTTNKVYKITNDAPIENYVLINNEQQELRLKNKITYLPNSSIYGELKFKSKPYLVTDENIGTEYEMRQEDRVVRQIDEQFQGIVNFKCNKLKPRRIEWKRSEKEPSIILKAPIHIFDFLEKNEY